MVDRKALKELMDALTWTDEARDAKEWRPDARATLSPTETPDAP